MKLIFGVPRRPSLIWLRDYLLQIRQVWGTRYWPGIQASTGSCWHPQARRWESWQGWWHQTQDLQHAGTWDTWERSLGETILSGLLLGKLEIVFLVRRFLRRRCGELASSTACWACGQRSTWWSKTPSASALWLTACAAPRWPSSPPPLGDPITHTIWGPVPGSLLIWGRDIYTLSFSFKGTCNNVGINLHNYKEESHHAAATYHVFVNYMC